MYALLYFLPSCSKMRICHKTKTEKTVEYRIQGYKKPLMEKRISQVAVNTKDKRDHYNSRQK
jgi:arsenate reductase-like glutaredoxin family protein